MNTTARTNRANSRGWRAYAIGAAVVTALLASTACQSEAGGGSHKTGSTKRPGASKPKHKPDDDTPGVNGNGNNAAIAPCTGDNLAASSVREPAGSTEARQLLLTVQNVGDKKCDLYHYPHVRLGADAQGMVPVIENSSPDPGKPVTIAPMEEAHVALLVAGGGRDEYEAKSITLTLHGRELGSKGSDPINVPLPDGPLYADDGQLVTYWTTASGGALDFIMSK
ncbi:DUF4232 domain-containing protein [Streptomyces sp. NPDC086080]|uniref:DUF4232 domain-containing protein n=1 Tax=Streptomyces sp. NPDC086080 TaxID=3365748 RepID=UPI0037D93C37